MPESGVPEVAEKTLRLYTESFPAQVNCYPRSKGPMGRLASGATLAVGLLGCILLAACSSSNPTHVVANQVPGSISLTPSPNVSLELGKTQALAATARNSAGTTIAETFSFQSSNPAVV